MAAIFMKSLILLEKGDWSLRLNGYQIAWFVLNFYFEFEIVIQASTTLGIIMSAFTLCWLPFFVLALVRPFLNSADQIPRWLSSLFLWLGYANSFLNPVIYATTNKDFRLPFKEILCLRYCYP